MPDPSHTILRSFAAAVTAKLAQQAGGEPEDQLRAPFENLVRDFGSALGWNIVCTGETPLPDRLGRPDYAVHLDRALSGFVELKAPGTGANVRRFKGRNKEQWGRFSAVPNILYTDGNEWALYRSGELEGKVVRLAGDVAADGKEAASPSNASDIERMLRDFLTWTPFIPVDRRGKIDLQGFARVLAPPCRMLRDDVIDALRDSASPLVRLEKDWRQLLFPDATDEQFADAYAQTVTFALLLGRSEGADPLGLESAEKALAIQHGLLARALQVLTDAVVRDSMPASLGILLRLISVVPTASLSGPEDPWLYFYEDFLAAYDPKLRKDVGAYYTPVEVVRAQVRLIDDLLRNRLGRPNGFVDPGVVTLDPAAGTGTYLLGVIEHALGRVEAEQGAGAVAGQATTLAANLYGFELMVGPYSVADLRVSRALRDRGAVLPKDGPHVYLTDTLESPDAVPAQLPLFLRPIADQHAKALKVKSDVPVIVCLGNPPYGRHEAATETNKARTGGWVRWGDDGKGAKAILESFLAPARRAGRGGDLKNIYNLYVYFWRWGLWKVFEQATSAGPGVLSFISASSYLEGDLFCGMREHMRRVCDEIWILELGGEKRGTRKTENVFEVIRTPVAIGIAVRSAQGRKRGAKPASVRYLRIEGTRAEKLARLDEIENLAGADWRNCPDEWGAPFRPAASGPYFEWPLLADLMPWRHSGVECKRTWPIAPDDSTLERRWRTLLASKDRGAMFRETPDRVVEGTYGVLLTPDGSSNPIAQLPDNAPVPPIRTIAFRSFDRQRFLADGRLISRARTSLWRAQGERQIHVTSLFNHPLGEGPALTASSHIPDSHHLRGSYGGKDVMPLYRTADASDPNLPPGLLALLKKTYRRAVSPEDFLAYVYGILAQPAFTHRHAAELETKQIRVPLTKKAALFERVRAIGARLLWLHTYGERLVPKGTTPGQIPRGEARCTVGVPPTPEGYPESFTYDEAARTLRVGAGEFAPVRREVFQFEVSGLKVVSSWLKYRMKDGAGKKSSPLDEIHPESWTSRFTTELLELLWVLEATLAGYPEQALLLEQVLAEPCFAAEELPPVPDEMRKPPELRAEGDDFLDGGAE